MDLETAPATESPARPAWQRWLGLFVVLQVLAIGSITVAGWLDDDPILDHLTDDFAAGRMEADARTTASGGPSDWSGECYLATAGYDDGTRPWLERVTGSPTFAECVLVADALERRAAGEELVATERFRYWHGLQVVSRPMLSLSGIALLRLVGLVAFVASFAWLASAMRRVGGSGAAVAFAAPFVVTGDLVALLDTFHHPVMLAIGFASIAWVMREAERGRSNERLAWCAFAAGAVYNFVDLLNFVPGVWLTMAGGVVLARSATASMVERMRSAIAVGAGWVVGYGLMWIMAWVWAAVATSPSTMWDDVTGKIADRVGADDTTTGGFGTGLLEVGRWWFARPGADVFIAGFVVVGLVGLWRLRTDRSALVGAALACAPATITIPWMLATGPHHESHDWFEFRSLPILLGLGLAALVAAHRGRFSTPAS